MANYIKGTKIQENSISETKLDSSLQSWKETVTNHINNNDNPHNITKSSIGLDNVTNDAQVKRSELGVANGVATLDSTGKVPSGQLPSYVDDVIEGYLYNGVFYKDTSYTTSIVGESGKIYIDLPTNKTYRWTGSVYGVISETIALGETSSTAYRGDRGKIAYDHSQSAHAPSNAQANVIETIKVNGTALTPNSKAVDITVPTVGNGTITIKQGGTSKGTFTTNQNGNTTIELTDTNTTYTAGDGLSLSGTTFSNNGVRSIATGTTNGTISVNTNGNISNIGVYGLKSAAYTDSSAYATASHTHSYLPLSGGTMSNTNVVTNLNADLLDGYHASSFSLAGHTHSQYLTSALIPAKLARKEMYPPGYFIIKINNNNSEWMLSFDVKIVVTDGSYTIRFSEDNRSMSKSWSSPSASMIDGEDSVEVKFGYSQTNKWVAILISEPYVGISITNVANGYAPIDTYALNKLFSIDFYMDDVLQYLGTVQKTITIYPPSKEGHTHTFASLTSKPTTISGYGIEDALKIDGSNGTAEGLYALINKLATATATPTDTDYYVCQFAGGGTTNTSYYRRPMSAMWNWIKAKTDTLYPSKTGTGATGTWGINISGNAASATKLANSRTIWGQSFDGTGNVDGYIISTLTDLRLYYNTNKLFLQASPTGIFLGEGTADTTYLSLFGKYIRLFIGSSEKMRIADSGNVGIGTTSPACKLDVVGDIRASKTLSSQSLELNGALPFIDFHYDGDTADYTSRIIEGVSGELTLIGKLRIGSNFTSPNVYTFHVASGDSFFDDNVITGSDFSSRGNAIIDGTVSCTQLLQTSDIKYKTNIKQIEYEEALKIIENLNPVTWDWNENTKISGSSSGFIAQEVKDIIPNAVSEGDENTLSLDYTQLHSYEIKVIQEQQKEIKDLKQRLEVLENLVLQLTNREI